jgi:molybdopterin synthase sulfur carrier subunit
MQIRVYATLRTLMGQAKISLPVEGATTVEDVLRRLAQAYPMLEDKLWDANGYLTGYVTVLLNGRSIEYLQGLATPVTEADVMALFPPVGGG